MKGQIGEAVCIAREKGHVRWSDIAPHIERYFSGFKWRYASGFNTSSSALRAKYYATTMAQWLRQNWNKSMLPKTYGNILTPDGVDENGDVIYKYTPVIKGE